MKTILFQGDSITDADRSRSHDWLLGSGYPTVVAAQLGSAHPGFYNFFNRGISGNRVVDVYARIRKDILNLKPDYMSMLIGVNDVWHEAEQNGVDAVKFEKIYCMMVEEIKEQLPDIRILILEPFVLRGTATAESYDSFFRPEVELRAAAAGRVAEKYGLTFVPLQKMFDDCAKEADGKLLLADGVHPTSTGHGLIAGKWMEAFEKLK